MNIKFVAFNFLLMAYLVVNMNLLTNSFLMNLNNETQHAKLSIEKSSFYLDKRFLIGNISFAKSQEVVKFNLHFSQLVDFYEAIVTIEYNTYLH